MRGRLEPMRPVARSAHVYWLMVILLEASAGILSTSAQYSPSSSAICDSSRLLRCQQEVLRDMQLVSLNSASIQYPISGPPYSPGGSLSGKLQQQQQQHLASPGTCRLVRSNLDCLLVNTPACYDQGIQAAQNTDILFRAKRFLEQNGCNEPDSTWQTSLCYRSPEIRSCEDRYGFTSSFAAGLITSNVSACLAYQAFKQCVDTHLRYNCKVHEMDMVNEYLIDRASDLSWRCQPINSSNPYQLNNQPAPILSPYNNYDAYAQRPTYVASNANNNNNLFGGVGSRREQAWERFQDLQHDTRGGISRYPWNTEGGNSVFDRLIAANQVDPDLVNSDCPVKAQPYARECENTLLDQQRLARDSRDGTELQRRVCCSLFQYRDCVSRVVLDRCADSTPAAVELIMGNRRREMTVACRGFNRDICSGAREQATLNMPLLIVGAILISLVTLKQSIL